jgi:hypothetical protein
MTADARAASEVVLPSDDPLLDMKRGILKVRRRADGWSVGETV